MKSPNDPDRGLGKVQLYADSALSPQHKNREGETQASQASGVADTADETEARSKRFIFIYPPTLTACPPLIHKAPMVPQIHPAPVSSCVEPRGFPQKHKQTN